MLGTFVLIFTALIQAHVSAYHPKSVAVEGRSLDQIYQAALKEPKTLTIAWGGDVKASGALIKSFFETKFPGMTLNVNLDLSKYLDGQADLKYASTNGSENGADVVVLQTLQNFPRWKSEGRLLPYKVSPWHDIYPEFVDKDAAYTGLFIYSFGNTVYDASVTHLDPLPATSGGFLAPEWKDKLILTYPNDDDSILFLFDKIIEKYGFDYIHSLQAQNPLWVRGTATPALLISPAYNNGTNTSNSRAISFTTTNGFAQGVAQKASTDVSISWPQTGAIFSSTKVPDSAKLLFGYLMDDEWQQLMSGDRFATRKTYDKLGVFNQSGIDPLAFGRFMSDRQRVEALRLKIEAVIGPPQGVDPVGQY
ncbi:hypothetical protein HYPSUDRAFT_57461 [Hypholoma sublateritium FD-334 SS-4]|uniref:ABC transporter substrate-binding protein n=1 Tax=Hypholoma sublateritium (strain FD-334 SS-4) TaxID=945553 RepID=A0A0D2M3S9_HYPSF|nr:hypothetical protein HYPSUDRAFT_57461 [Hypholoma sublateritium FD-334 SS-4]